MLKKILSVNPLVVFSVIVLSSVHAKASLIVDLRFPITTLGYANAHSVFINDSGGGVYTVEVWAQIRGTDTTGTNEKMLNFFGSIQSQQINGGMILPGTSGVSGNAGFGPAFDTTSAGRPGTAQNLTVDGVGDWGTTATNNLNTIKYNTTDNSGLNYEGSSFPGITANLLDEGSANAGVEFLVGKVAININAADIKTDYTDDEETRFNWIRATSGGAISTHSVRIDGATTGSEAPSQYLLSQSPANSVSFVVLIPEPSSIAFLGLGTLFLVRRNRFAGSFGLLSMRIS